MKRFSILTAFAVILSLPASAALKDYVNAVTGNTHTRIVWLHGNADGRMTGGGDMWGFDSETGVSQKLFNGSTNLFYRPIICAGGNKIVVTTIKDCKVYIYNWDGTGQRYLARGVCSDVFKDPSTGKEHIIVHTRTDGSDWRRGTGILKRYSIDDPTQVMTLFDAWSFKGESWYQVTGDGKMGAGFFPWDQVYHVVDGGLVKNGAHTALTIGCWTSATSDDSHYWFHLDYVDGHDRIQMYRDKTLIKDDVMIFPGSVPPTTLTTEMYHPKFASNGARYYVQTAGYVGNRGYYKAEVYFGKFSADYKSLGDCIRMTNDDVSDYWPDAWVGVETIDTRQLNLDGTDLNFAASIGGSAPATQTLTATAAGGLDLSDISVTESASWLSTSVSGSGGTRTITNSIVMSGLTAGTKTATVTVEADSKSEEYTVTLVVTDPSAYHRKFDLGDSPLSGWEAADPYVSGGQYVSSTATVSITGVTDAAPADLYKSCRHQGFDFSLPVPDGDYTVRCHTVEWHYTTMADAAANRDMDITIEGDLVEEGLNPAAAAGALEKAAVLEYAITVDDGALNLSVASTDGDAYLMGIEVIGVPVSGITAPRTVGTSGMHTGCMLYTLDGRPVPAAVAPAGIYLVRENGTLTKVLLGH